MRPEHAAVEVEVENGKMVVDALFGLWFPRSEGGYYGIQDLKQNPKILEKRVNYFRSRNEQPGGASIHFYPLDRYTYTNARTINWDKSSGMKLLYNILKGTMGEKVNQIQRPELVEEPALMILYGTIALEAGIFLMLMVVVRRGYRGKKLTPSPTGGGDSNRKN